MASTFPGATDGRKDRVRLAKGVVSIVFRMTMMGLSTRCFPSFQVRVCVHKEPFLWEESASAEASYPRRFRERWRQLRSISQNDQRHMRVSGHCHQLPDHCMACVSSYWQSRIYHSTDEGPIAMSPPIPTQSITIATPQRNPRPRVATKETQGILRETIHA